MQRVEGRHVIATDQELVVRHTQHPDSTFPLSHYESCGWILFRHFKQNQLLQPWHEHGQVTFIWLCEKAESIIVSLSWAMSLTCDD